MRGILKSSLNLNCLLLNDCQSYASNDYLGSFFLFLCLFFFFFKKKKLIKNITTFSILLLLAQDGPQLAGAVFKTTCSMDTFNLLVIFKQLFLLILLSLAHADKRK